MRRAWTWGTEVYFIQESGMGAIKIGITGRKAHSRLLNMVSSTPHSLTLLAAIDGDRKLESSLHSRFASACIRGEWFRPVPELLAYIEEAKRQPRVDLAYEAAKMVSALIPSRKPT